VDSRARIDFFDAADTVGAPLLDGCLSSATICIGGMIRIGAVQGFSTDKDYGHARELLAELPGYRVSQRDNHYLRWSAA